MDREKIERALTAVRAAGNATTRHRQIDHREEAEALLQAALDEVDALPEPDPLAVLTEARYECKRQEDAAHYNSREAEAWSRAEDAIFDALNVASNYGGRADADQQIKRWCADGHREKVTADA